MDRPWDRKEVDTTEQLTHTHDKCTITFVVTHPLFFLRFNSVYIMFMHFPQSHLLSQISVSLFLSDLEDSAWLLGEVVPW